MFRILCGVFPALARPSLSSFYPSSTPCICLYAQGVKRSTPFPPSLPVPAQLASPLTTCVILRTQPQGRGNGELNGKSGDG